MIISPTLDFETELWEKGYNHLAGVDEVGRGSWAGPVVAAAVILPRNFKIPENFADSKQVKPLFRRKLAKLIAEIAISYSIAEIGLSSINKLGIGKASQMAFRKCVKSLSIIPDYILIDAFYIKHLNRRNQTAIKKGDEKSATIAAASIIAKVHRDNLMRKLSKKYPYYGFAKNKGYGTSFHQTAIKTYGFSKIHRKSFDLNFLFA